MKQRQGNWLAVVASVGVGAATYYNMTRQGRGIGNTMQQMVPFVAGMGGQSNQGAQNSQQSTGQPSMAQQQPQ